MAFSIGNIIKTAANIANSAAIAAKEPKKSTTKSSKSSSSKSNTLDNVSISALETLSDLKGVAERSTNASEKATAEKQIASWNKSYGADTSISKSDLDNYINQGKANTGTTGTQELGRIVTQEEAKDSPATKVQALASQGKTIYGTPTGIGTTSQVPTAQATRGVTSAQATGSTSLQAQLEEAQRSATMASLDKARTQSNLALDTEQATIEPQYAEQRSQARATSARGAQQFSEFLAQRGLSSSGGAALGETQRLGALQGTLGTLGTQEQADLSDIAARRTAIDAAYQSDVAATEANLQAQSLQNQITAAETARQEALAQEAADKQSYLTTIGQYAQDYQSQINALTNDGDTSNDWQIPYLAAARQQKISSQNLDPVTGQVIETPTTLSFSQAESLWNLLGKATPEIVAAMPGVQVGQTYSTAASRAAASKSYGGGSSKTTTTVNATPEQQQAYMTAREGFANLVASKGQQSASAEIQQLLPYYSNTLGTDLYNQFVSDIKSVSDAGYNQMISADYNAQVEEPQPTGTLANEIGEMINDGLSRDEIYEILNSNQAAFKSSYSTAELNKYLKSYKPTE